jgi:mono/diheme cytochrome c family protein
MGTIDDRRLAAILTYVRGAWGHNAGAIAPEAVARVRADTGERRTPWTPDELSALRR